MTDTAVLELKKVSFSYPMGEPVLDNLDFSLVKGEKVGLIGPNGSGKTTLLHLMMGLLKPQQGDILINGNKMNGNKEFEQERLKIGFLFQHADDQLFCPSVLEDVAFGPLNQGLGKEKALERARQTLGELGLGDFEDRVPYRLSGGEKKLVALATILAMRPEMLLLDEPTTGLDMKTKDRIVTVLNGLEIPFIVVSHEMDFLLATTNKLLGLENGKIVEDGYDVHEHAHAHPLGRHPHVHER